MNTEEKLSRVRDELKKAEAAAYLCAACDPHESEYISDHYKVTEYLTGFTGENATLLVTADEALLWTDSRFFIQGARELSDGPVRLMKSGEKDVPEVCEYISGVLKAGYKLLTDMACLDRNMRKKLKEIVESYGIELYNDRGFADMIWPDRPAVLAHPVSIMEDDIFGGSVKDKLKSLRDVMAGEKIDIYRESRLDNLMWLFNLRGRDIPYNTLAFAHGRITKDEAAIYLYDEAVDDTIREHMAVNGVKIENYDEFVPDFGDAKDLISPMKACKSEAQIEQIRKYFLLDSLAVTRFLNRLDEKLKDGDPDALSEKKLAALLHEERKKIDGFLGESFETISAYGANAALPHYSSAGEGDVKIEKRGFYLCDSGGFYPGVTTDVTRTVACGELTQEERRAYTLVAAGWARLMNAVWREGCTGLNLDILARLRLWEAGLDYGHGTGHGVGAGLCVHEGPQSISFRTRGEAAVLKPGMLVTCEPGYYKEGPMEGENRGYGIRIENTLLVVKDEHEGFLKFEPLTLVPIDLTPLDRTLLSEEEMRMIDDYQNLVSEKLGKLTL